MKRRTNPGPFRKILTSWAILALALGYAGPAWAAAGKGTTTSGSIVISQGISHPASAYQVFDGDVEEDGSIADIGWGSGVEFGGLVDDLKKTTEFKDMTDPRAIAQKLSIITYNTSTHKWEINSSIILTSNQNVDKETALAKTFAEIVSRHLKADGAKHFDDITTPEVKDLDDGWYVVASDGGTMADGAALLFPGLITVGAGEVSLTPKESAPTFKKELLDDAGSWGGYADFEIGQTFQQRLVATIGDSDLGYYKSYYLCFTDTIPEGFDLDERSVDITIDGIGRTDDFGFRTSYINRVLKVEAQNILSEIHAGSEIVVTYEAKLNNRASVGATGNVNEAKLTYSADPRTKKEGVPEITNDTPEDRTYAYTYQLKLTKTDSADPNLTLEGAKFSLKNSQGKYALLMPADGSGVDNATSTNEGKAAVVVSGWVNSVQEGGYVTTGSDGCATIVGLDASDTYVLNEAVAPDGYNLDTRDIPFVISASTATETALTSLSVAVSSGEPQEGNPQTGTVSVGATNVKAPILPITGLGGVASSVVLGSGLVAASAVVVATQASRKDRR